jgi:imidazole glycerol-phosphate synthase subunit HisH
MTVSALACGVGNLGSVRNMLKRIDVECRVIERPEEVTASERILLPEVGAFDHAMARLNEAGLTEALRQYVKTGRPLMGICLGMQLLLDSSEEGELSGLGLIPGGSERFPSLPGLRILHMGWNSIDVKRHDPLTSGVEEGGRFYFVHSYHAVPKKEDHVLATTDYGQAFVSMVRSGNVMGAQFRPEKSHSFGMTILRNSSVL